MKKLLALLLALIIFLSISLCVEYITGRSEAVTYLSEKYQQQFTYISGSRSLLPGSLVETEYTFKDANGNFFTVQDSGFLSDNYLSVHYDPLADIWLDSMIAEECKVFTSSKGLFGAISVEHHDLHEYLDSASFCYKLRIYTTESGGDPQKICDAISTVAAEYGYSFNEVCVITVSEETYTAANSYDFTAPPDSVIAEATFSVDQDGAVSTGGPAYTVY